MYFRLNPECYFIQGDRFGAIYDLIEGEVYSLNSDETILIKECENNQTVERPHPLLNELKSRCLGNYFENKVYIDKLHLGSPLQDYQPGRRPLLGKAFLEINNTCNYSCWFCGSQGIHRSQGCMGCNTWSEEGTGLGLDEWKQVIDNLADLDCRSLFFTGGDLTLKWEVTRDLVNYASEKLFKSFVIINSKSCSRTIVEDLKNKAVPIIQTDNVEEIHNGDHYTLVTDGKIETSNKDISSHLVAVDIVSQDFTQLPQDLPLISKKKVLKTDLFRFSRNTKNHPCLANSLTISWKGEVLPCPLLREKAFGNVKNQHLYEIFKKNADDIKKLWTMNLGKIQKCKRCEFRYACNDCRALEETLTGDFYGKKLCRYNPEKGIWI